MKVRNFLMAFVLSLLLLTNVVFAQEDIIDIIMGFLEDWGGLIFILVFVIFLLLVAGVIRMPRGPGGGILSLIFFIIIIALIFFLPGLIGYEFEMPDNFQVIYLGDPVADVFEMAGLQRDWAWVPAFIYLFVLPFAGVYTLVWAFLSSMGIFGQANVNRILALIIVLITIPFNLFVGMVYMLFSFMSMWAILVFAAMFILGILFRGAGFAKREFAFIKAVTGPMADAERFKSEAQAEIRRSGIAPDQAEAIIPRIEALYGHVANEGMSRKQALLTVKAAIREAQKRK